MFSVIEARGYDGGSCPYYWASANGFDKFSEDAANLSDFTSTSGSEAIIETSFRSGEKESKDHAWK